MISVYTYIFQELARWDFEDKNELEKSSCWDNIRLVKMLIMLKRYMNNSPNSGKKGKK